MKGRIRPHPREAKCHLCGQKYEEVSRLGFICKKCKTTPKHFCIDLWWKSKRIRIYSDDRGYSLTSYQQALDLQSKITREIEDYKFDPSKYIKSEQKQFWVLTMLDKFLKAKLPDIAPSYKKHYEKYVEIHKNFWHTKDVREITKLDLANYLEYLKTLKSAKDKNKTLSPKTIKNILDNFKTFMIWLKDDLEIITHVPKFPTLQIPTPAITWFDKETQNKIFEAIPDRFKPIVYFMIRYGVRPGEARCLKVKDIDLNNGIIKITSTFSGNQIKNRRKGRGAKPLILPIISEFKPYFEKIVRNSLPEAFVFVNPLNGKPFSAWSLDLMWRKIREHFNLDKRIRLYDFTRHSLASQLVNEGIPLNVIQKLLGHTTPQTTEKYAHMDLSTLQTVLENQTNKIAEINCLHSVSKG